MARPLRIEYPGAFYHVMSRGNERRAIFRDEEDRKRFLGWLVRAFRKFRFWIHAYALLENHYHLYMETLEGNLSKILHFVNGGYTQYFNEKYERVGHLFQGRYKAILVDKDHYSLELVRYIHLNPVKAGWVSKPDDTRWTSYRCYLGLEPPPPFLKTDWILAQFENSEISSQRLFERFTFEALRDEENLMRRVWKGSVLGETSFIEGVKEKFLRGKPGDDSEVPLLKEGEGKLNAEEIERQAGEDVELRTYLLWKYSSLKLREIAARVGGSHPSTVTQRAKRLEQKMVKDLSYRERVRRIEEILSNVKA